MSYRALFFLVSLTCLVAVACGDAFSTEGGGGEAGVGAEGGTAPGGSGPCVEVPEIPSKDWDGPVMVAAAGSEALLPECENAGDKLLAYANLVQEPLDCSCHCSSPQLSDCTASLDVYASGNSCTGVSLSGIELPHDQCSQLAAGSDLVADVKWELGPPAVGSCTVVPPPPCCSGPSWGRSARACRVLTRNKGDVQCATLAAGFEQSLCIFSRGDLACPSSYPEKRVFYSDALDDRSCSGECGCNGSSLICKGTIDVYEGSACATATSHIYDTSDCESVNGRAARYTANLDGSCTASASRTPTGGLTATDPYTVCCAAVTGP